MIVGDDEPGGIDDEAGAERVDPPRRAVLIAAALAAAPVLEEFVEKLLHRRTRRQIGQPAHAGVDLLRRRDVDDGVDHLFGNVGDVFRSARCRRPGGRQRDHCRKRGERESGPRQTGQMARHGRLLLKH